MSRSMRLNGDVYTSPLLFPPRHSVGNLLRESGLVRLFELSTLMPRMQSPIAASSRPLVDV